MLCDLSQPDVVLLVYIKTGALSTVQCITFHLMSQLFYLS